MIKREDFEQYEKMVEAIKSDLVLYADQVSQFATLEECEAEEQILMASMDEVQAHLENVKYTLPSNTTYADKNYTKNEGAVMIIYFLNKLEVRWEQTLGLYDLVTLWKNENFTEIPYGVYDSTLRCLNQVTFKGMSEWTDILVINTYLGQCHNEYSLDTGMLHYLSECHNMVMNRMKELDPTAGVPDAIQE